MTAGYRPNILIVEDNASVRDLFELVFEPASARLLHATSLGAGLRLIGSERIDLAIVDYWLPDGDGGEVLRALREAQPHAQAILATAWGSDRSANEMVKQGAFAYLKKPFDVETLRVHAQRALLLSRLAWENEHLQTSMQRFGEEVSSWEKEVEAVRRLAALPSGPEDTAAHCRSAMEILSQAVGESVGLAYYASSVAGDELSIRCATGLGPGAGLPASLLTEGGLVGRALEEHRLVTSGAEGEPAGLGREKGSLLQLNGFAAAAAYPIEMKGRCVGVLVAGCPEGPCLGRAEEILQSSVGRFFGLAMQNAFLMEAATVDGLTALHNRRYFDLRLEQEVSRAKRHGRALTLCLADLDRFKSLNDTHGHIFGDKVLRGVSGCWQSGLRKSDFAARYGGEELALILPETSLAGGRLAAEKVREAIARLRFKAPKNGSPRVGVTVSIGLASYPEQASRPEDLLGMADQALYEAKRSGGDRVASAGG
ncbi:MAG: hypothetical protein A3J27_04480 [Candidatus Tectomicrobia bacterium RIFCSPLOWO2_12_FULL_69_37]|nr:MAG: hypothetical protein A3J27_04480 [Candidatus Tectomicrobia bacterium RIFCSPLOWO2_12_FULL_69_37]